MTIVSCLSLLEAAVVLGQPETACSPGFPANALSFHELNVDFWHSCILRVFLGKCNVKNRYPGMVYKVFHIFDVIQWPTYLSNLLASIFVLFQSLDMTFY